MSDGHSAGETEHPSRCSDPITERGGLVGRGAVLYDTRDPHARPCCARSEGRCLAHVLGVFEETTTGTVYFKVADGTWTTEEWIHADDLLAIFEPAGWSVTGVKPTYLLTREHGVADHHDLMTDGGTVEDGGDQPDSGLFAEHKEELPEEWHDAFDALTAQGKSPTGIKATIEYVITPKTQQEVSQEFNVSEVTIRNLQAAVVALGSVEAKRGSSHGAEQKTAMDYCNHIADRLGWDEDIEFSVSDGVYNSTPQPAVLKEGWRSLYRAIASGSKDSKTRDTTSTRIDSNGGDS